jgi:hypothetical protein
MPFGAARVPVALVAAAAVGLLFGFVSGALLWASYPPARHMAWVPAVVALGSTAVVAAAYALLAFRLELRATADWLAAGWLVAVLVLAVMVVTYEALVQIRARIPAALGVRTSAAASRGVRA